METRTLKELWQIYLNVTLEMNKFLAREDVDMFLNLMDQREKLQEAIDNQPADEFRLSPEGQEILGRIRQENLLIMHRMQIWLNTARQQQSLSQAYDRIVSVGGYMDFTR